MELQTTRFGIIEVDPASVITFTQPILGFQEFRRYILLPGPNNLLTWLQSTDSGDLAFMLIDPRNVFQNYRVELRPEELVELAVTSVSELNVYTLVVVPQDPSKVRTNLKAPIVISPKHRLGKQTILDRSAYPVQYFLAQAKQAAAPEGVANARSDA